MNLDNLSENEFDAEIKQQLENSSVPFDPVSWEQMNQKLDYVFPKNNSGNSGFFELLIVLFMLSILFFWNVGRFPETNLSMDDSINTTVGQSSNDQRPSPSADLEQEITPGQPKSENYGVLQDTEQRNLTTKSPTNLVADKEKAPTVIAAGVDSNNSSLTQISTTEVPSMTKNNSTVKIAEETALRISAIPLISSNQPDINSFDQQPLPDQIKGTNLNIEDPPIIAASSSPWFLGFGYAPDFSRVGSSEVAKPGANLSIILEYQLNRRWSIQSGLTYSKKNYKAKGEDYTPPKGFWDYGVVPEMTYATCEVIDIPLNIRYYFRPEKKNRLFVGTGLSTYLFLTEDYFYQYQDGNPLLVQSWSGKNENQHYFAIYNLSFGYQRSIGKQWFLEIEPFIKLPLTGVGFGQVDLWSTGTSFSLKYNFR